MPEHRMGWLMIGLREGMTYAIGAEGIAVAVQEVGPTLTLYSYMYAPLTLMHENMIT